MQITPVKNNINFGYNKKLNKQLITRLEQNPDLPINQTLLSVNQFCNETETRINKLEGTRQQFTDENENAINILADCLINAKTYLCKTVDRMFPDLNFTQKECDTYDREISEVELPEIAESEDGVREAYIWKDILIGNLTDIQTQNQKISSPLNEDYRFDKNFDKNTLTEALLGTQAQESNSPVEKFTPFSHSPKSLDDVVGVKQSVQDVRDLIVFPLENPAEAKQREEDYGIEIPGFTVFFGPPGCGKTMLAEAIAAETGCDMYLLDLSKTGSSYVNGTVKNISQAFEYVKEQAKNSEKPVLLFLDEMDSMLKKRDGSDAGSSEDNKVVNALLPMLTQAKDNNILVIGATNMYDMLDNAAQRRIKLKCYIGLPNEKEITKLLENKLSSFKKGENLAKNEEALNKIAPKLVGYSPSNINDMVDYASKIAYKNNDEITPEYIVKALEEGNWEKINEQDYLPENKKTKKIIGF